MRAGVRQWTAKLPRDRVYPLIARPEFCPADGRGGQQVNVDVTDAFAMKAVAGVGCAPRTRSGYNDQFWFPGQKQI